MTASPFHTRSPRGLPASATPKAAFQILSTLILRILLVAGLAGTAVSASAAGHLQCVPYARAESGIAIRGNAGTWWSQAAGHYRRGAEPRVGAVLAFRPSRAMPIGHVAVVAEVIDNRHILLNHANWSGPGRIDRGVLAQDKSENGDWSVVRVWYAPQHSLGLRTNPTFGFIYNDGPTETPPVQTARTDDFASTIAAAIPAGTD